MKSIFDKATREEVIARVNSLSENSKAEWGKMNVSQMIKHCVQWDEMAQGKTKYNNHLSADCLGRWRLRI